MEIADSFTVPVTASRLWDALTDVERIAPCIPGFTLVEADDPEYKGVMKVRVGAIGIAYNVTITFVERDEDAMRTVLSISGKESKGSGGIQATVTSSLEADGESTTTTMVTNVKVTGRIAQFGRGLIGDVSARLIEQFVEALTERVLFVPGAAPTTDPIASALPAIESPVGTAAPANAELDLGRAVGLSVLRRAAPVVVGLCFVVALLTFLRRR